MQSASCQATFQNAVIDLRALFVLIGQNGDESLHLGHEVSDWPCQRSVRTKPMLSGSVSANGTRRPSTRALSGAVPERGAYAITRRQRVPGPKYEYTTERKRPSASTVAWSGSVSPNDSSNSHCARPAGKPGGGARVYSTVAAEAGAPAAVRTTP